MGVPAEKRANPQNVVDGQFSGPFVLSTALVTGAMGWDSYQKLQDPVIRAMLPKVACVHDDDIEAEFPTNMSGRITIRARGQDFTMKVTTPKGEPDNFLTEAELRSKFLGLTAAVLGGAQAAALADVVLAIDQAANVTAMFDAAEPVGAVRLAGE